MTTLLDDCLVEVYDSGGQQAIYDYVREHFPEWKWGFCEPCDTNTPTYEGTCAVCFTQKEDY